MIPDLGVPGERLDANREDDCFFGIEIVMIGSVPTPRRADAMVRRAWAFEAISVAHIGERTSHA